MISENKFWGILAERALKFEILKRISFFFSFFEMVFIDTYLLHNLRLYVVNFALKS